jgi:hypothetical protein
MYKLLAGLLLLGILTACPTETKPPDSNEPIIPTTTKVADPKARETLRSFDPQSGQMRFAAGSGVLNNLAAGDVLASEIGPNAPHGYLRKITSVRRENGEVLLETTQASLEEAIHNGDLNFDFDLKPDDLVSVRALAEGVTAGLAPKSTGVRPQEIGIGDGMNFRVGIDETLLDVNEQGQDVEVKAKVKLTGEVFFNAGYGIKISIRGPLPKLEYVEGSVGFEQRASLKIFGDARAKMTKEKKIAEYRFATKCVVIVVVPVCVTPAVFVKVGGSGELNLSFDYSAEQRATAKVGVRWSGDRGWEKFDGNPQVNAGFRDSLKVNASLNAEAYAKAEAALLLYNAAGPTLGAKLGMALDAAIPRNPIWIAKAKLEGYYGFVVDLPVFGRVAESNGTLFKLEKEFGRSQNNPPRLELLGGINNASAQLGVETTLGPDCVGGFAAGYAMVSDLEDGCGGVQVSRSSNLEGALGYKHRFQRAGSHQITMTARDSQGATASVQFTLNALNTNPVLAPQFPERVIEGEEQVFAVNVSDINEPNTDLCPNVIWTITSPDTISQTTGCAVKINFPRVGSRNVSVRVTDSHGGAAQRDTVVNVLAPPNNPYPRILSSGLYARDVITNALGSRYCGEVLMPLGATIDLKDNRLNKGCRFIATLPPVPRYFAKLEVDNPSNEALIMDWRLEYVNDGETLVISEQFGPQTSFEPGAGGNQTLVTKPCTLKVKVIAPEASRNRDAIVWTGKCSFWVGTLK